MRRRAILIANVRVPTETPPIAGMLAWYIAAAVVLVVLLIGLARLS